MPQGFNGPQLDSLPRWLKNKSYNARRTCIVYSSFGMFESPATENRHVDWSMKKVHSQQTCVYFQLYETNNFHVFPRMVISKSFQKNLLNEKKCQLHRRKYVTIHRGSNWTSNASFNRIDYSGYTSAALIITWGRSNLTRISNFAPSWNLSTHPVIRSRGRNCNRCN